MYSLHHRHLISSLLISCKFICSEVVRIQCYSIDTTWYSTPFRCCDDISRCGLHSLYLPVLYTGICSIVIHIDMMRVDASCYYLRRDTAPPSSGVMLRSRCRSATPFGSILLALFFSFAAAAFRFR